MLRKGVKGFTLIPTYSGKGGAWSGGASGSTIKPPLLPAVT